MGSFCAFPGAVPLIALAGQRTLDQKADLTAIEVVARAGFDADALVRYVDRVQVWAGPVRSVFSVAPLAKKRVASMKTELTKLPADANPADSSAFIEATEEVRRLLATPNPRFGCALAETEMMAAPYIEIEGWKTVASSGQAVAVDFHSSTACRRAFPPIYG